jgi:hypothetical protein
LVTKKTPVNMPSSDVFSRNRRPWSRSEPVTCFDPLPSSSNKLTRCGSHRKTPRIGANVSPHRSRTWPSLLWERARIRQVQVVGRSHSGAVARFWLPSTPQNGLVGFPVQRELRLQPTLATEVSAVLGGTITTCVVVSMHERPKPVAICNLSASTLRHHLSVTEGSEIGRVALPALGNCTVPLRAVSRTGRKEVAPPR